MSGVSDDNTIEDMGPVDYLVVEYPDGPPSGEALPYLVDLVDRGIIRILDLVFVRKDPDGSVTAVELDNLAREGDPYLAVFEGASSGLLGRDDIEEAGTVLGPGSAAAVVLYENVWAAPLVRAMRRSGARLVAAGRIPKPDLVAALDAAEASA